MQIEGLSTVAIWPRGTTPPRATAGRACMRRAPPPDASRISRPGGRGSTLQLEKQACTPGAPRACAAGRAVSSNSNPPRLRTPPPAQPAVQQRGAPRADQGLIQDPGVRPRAGGPWALRTKAPARGGVAGRGVRGRLWKQAVGLTMGGAERARIRGGCGPRGPAGQERERTARTTRGRGGRPRPPRGPPAPERCGARRGRTMAGGRPWASRGAAGPPTDRRGRAASGRSGAGPRRGTRR